MYTRKIIIPSLIVLFVLLSSIAISPLPVHATSITVNPSSGTVGSTAVVKGENFTGRFATIYFDEKIIATEVPISSGGAFNFDIEIPTVPRGAHTIHVVDSSNWEASSASIDFKVVPRIKVFPIYVPHQSSITVTGYGFSSNETDIRVTWDGEIATPSPTNAGRDGSWYTTFAVNYSKGEHYISAVGSATEMGDIEEVMVTVTPWSVVTPLSGTVGTKFIIEGWGFRSGEDGITVTWDNEILLCNATAESDGSVLIDGSKRTDGTLRYELFVPPATQGKHVIGLYGSSFTPRGILPDYDFDVLPSISIEPDTGNTGTQVNITGTGFAANEFITVSYDDNDTDASSTTDAQGNFTIVFKIPRNKGKEHIISATGDKSNSSQATFTLLNEIPEAPQLVYPEKDAKIALFNSIGEVFGGTWRYLTNIRDYSKGTKHRIYTRTPTILDWSYGEGFSKANYILQIAQDDAFSSLVLNEENLDSSQYNLSEDGMLPKGIYYWRVKAVDTRDNESEWSETYRLEVTSMPVIVLVLSIVCLVLIIAAIAFGILLLLANMSRY
jgi:hypothetical protein